MTSRSIFLCNEIFNDWYFILVAWLSLDCHVVYFLRLLVAILSAHDNGIEVFSIISISFGSGRILRVSMMPAMSLSLRSPSVAMADRMIFLSVAWCYNKYALDQVFYETLGCHCSDNDFIDPIFTARVFTIKPTPISLGRTILL